MYPHPPKGLKNLKQVRVTSDVPPPWIEKVETVRVTSDVPPPNDKVGCQVKVTLWFWVMYPPRDWKS